LRWTEPAARANTGWFVLRDWALGPVGGRLPGASRRNGPTTPRNAHVVNIGDHLPAPDRGLAQSLSLLVDSFEQMFDTEADGDSLD